MKHLSTPSISHPPIRHILWDWNGTLLNDLWLCLDSLNTLRERRGMPSVSLEAYREIFGFPIIAYYEAMGFDFTKESFDTLADEWMALYTGRVREKADLYEGVRSALKEFATLGVRQTILSAHHQDTLRTLAEDFGVAGHFDEIIGLTDFQARGKVDIAKDWLHRSAANPEEIILIGDTLHDYEVARGLGARCLLVACGHQSFQRLRATGAEVLGSVSEAAARITGGLTEAPERDFI